MEYIIIPIIAAIASLLTFFSGFGLGTILTPVFMIFFPIDLAIAMTAIVHFLNNLFKVSLIGKHIDFSILLKFGGTAIIGAFFGAKLLFQLEHQISNYEFVIGGHTFITNLTNVVIGMLMIIFSLFDIIPYLKKLTFTQKALLPGGVISGFFGGLSGHQGALRSTFLIKCNLEKNAFIATGIAIACVVDITRLSVYSQKLSSVNIFDNIQLIIISCLAAFSGAIIGKKLLQKVTISFIQYFVAIGIILLAIGLMLGIF